MVPKCTSWRGHKFEARYSEFMPPGTELSAKSSTPGFVRSLKTITYECDICVRCGHVVDHKANEKAND